MLENHHGNNDWEYPLGGVRGAKEARDGFLVGSSINP